MMTLQASRKAQAILSSRKHKIRVHVIAPNNIPEINTASYWDGGSRDQFGVLNLDTMKVTIPPSGVYPRFDAKHALQLREVLMRTGIFMGKPGTPSITFHAEDTLDVARVFDLDLTNESCVHTDTIEALDALEQGNPEGEQ